MNHYIKTLYPFFEAVWDGTKTFEVRKDDRRYSVGDWVVLQEIYQDSLAYSGKTIQAKVIYKLEGGQFGIEEGYCVLGIQVTYKFDPSERPVKYSI